MTTRLSKRHIIAIFGLVTILVLFIIAVLTALGFKAGRKAVDDARILKAKHAMTNLNMAVESFHDGYNRLPKSGRPQPTRTDGSGLMDALLGLNKAENPSEISMFPPLPVKTGKGGLIYPAHTPPTGVKLHDPWGNRYFVEMDTDADSRITDPFDPSRIIFGLRAISWSAGPDGKCNLTTPAAPENADNVYSWK